MKTFTDSTGRAWRLRLTIGATERVLGACGLDLLDPLGGEPAAATRLRSDARLFGRVLAELVETSDREADSRKLLDALDGQTKAAAWTAFVAEWQDFFQRDGRPEVGEAISRHEALIDEATRRAAETIRKLDISALIDDAMKSIDSPARSASTLGL